jgi:hypothetical protein
LSIQLNLTDMKKSYLLIIGLFITITFSCKKNEKLCCVLPTSDSRETAERNGILYETPDVHGALSTDSIAITSAGLAGISNNDFILDSLSVKLKYTGIGTYKLSQNQVYYFIRLSLTNTYSANTPVNTYTLDTNFDNSLTISDYNSSTNIMSGTFSVKFIDPNSATDISLLSGTFMFPVSK